jgi:uncharacterized lipoprotein YmbA
MMPLMEKRVADSQPNNPAHRSEPEGQSAWGCGQGFGCACVWARRIRVWDLARLIALAAICLPLCGCFGFLKPVKSTARQFVLTPLAAPESASKGAPGLGVGVGQVKVPGYLFDSSLAVRNGSNEVVYLSSVLWAERLDNGLQRVLASNLGTLLPSDMIRTSAWRSQDVSAEVYVVVNRFDVDATGQGVLSARWRILAPGGEKLLKAGTGQFTRKGAAPGSDPSGAVSTLSDLVGELSQKLAESIKEVASTAP